MTYRKSLIALLVATASIGGTAYAAPVKFTAHVERADLATNESQAALYTRLVKQARYACLNGIDGGRRWSKELVACRKDLIGQAVLRIDSPHLTSLAIAAGDLTVTSDRLAAQP